MKPKHPKITVSLEDIDADSIKATAQLLGTARSKAVLCFLAIDIILAYIIGFGRALESNNRRLLIFFLFGFLRLQFGMASRKQSTRKKPSKSKPKRRDKHEHSAFVPLYNDGIINPVSTIKAILEVSPDGTVHVPLPPELQHGKVKVTATLEAAEPKAEKSRLKGFGSFKGKIHLAPDFDQPLDDFKEYME